MSTHFMRIVHFAENVSKSTKATKKKRILSIEVFDTKQQQNNITFTMGSVLVINARPTRERDRERWNRNDEVQNAVKFSVCVFRSLEQKSSVTMKPNKIQINWKVICLSVEMHSKWWWNAPSHELHSSWLMAWIGISRPNARFLSKLIDRIDDLSVQLNRPFWHWFPYFPSKNVK